MGDTARGRPGPALRRRLPRWVQRFRRQPRPRSVPLGRGPSRSGRVTLASVRSFGRGKGREKAAPDRPAGPRAAAGANGCGRGRVTGGAAAAPAGWGTCTAALGSIIRGCGADTRLHPPLSRQPLTRASPRAERSEGRRGRQSKDGRDPRLVLERAVLAAAQRHLGGPAEHGGSRLPAGGGPLPRLPPGLLHLHDPAALRKVTPSPSRRPGLGGPKGSRGALSAQRLPPPLLHCRPYRALALSLPPRPVT